LGAHDLHAPNRSQPPRGGNSLGRN
jgi:hypothetical protein